MTNIELLVKDYRDIRDELDIKRKEFDKFEKESKARLENIEQAMLDISREMGVLTFKTAHGTASRVTKTYARLSAGPDAKISREKYALETGDFGLFTSHVNKTHAKELKDDGMNLADLGVDWVEEYAFQVRKPT